MSTHADAALQYEQIRAAHAAAIRRNPLLILHACPEFCGSPACQHPTERHPGGGRPKQHEYLTAHDRIVLEAAGNRFGKTTANVVFAIIQHTPDELLPERLRLFRRSRPAHIAELPVAGRYIAPSQKSLDNIVLPEMQRWVPKDILRGGSWANAFAAQKGILHFADGGRLEFYTNEQDPAVMVGTSLDYCIFDEPVDEAVFGECWMRLTDRRGQARFGLTPVNMKGGGIGWLYRNIYKRGMRGEPYPGTSLVPRVLRAQIDDNPALSDEDIEEALAVYDASEREARRTGEFVAFAGLIYPNFKSYVVPADRIEPEMIRQQQVIVGIDPGYHSAAFVWIAFNDQNQGLIFHEELVQHGDPLKFAQALRRGNSEWGLRQRPLYVMDPYAGGQHNAVSGAVTVKSELEQLGFFTQHPKVLDSDAIVWGGVANLHRRMGEKPPSFACSSACEHTIDEAEEYRTEDREDGVFQPVKEQDHFMDAMRYAFTWRPWFPRTHVPGRIPTIRPGEAPDWTEFNEGALAQEYPLGSTL